MNTYRFTEQQVRTLSEAAFDAGVSSVSCQLGTCDASSIDDEAVAFDRESAVLVALAAIIAEPKAPCSGLADNEARSLRDLIPAADAPMDEFGAQVSPSGERVVSNRSLSSVPPKVEAHRTQEYLNDVVDKVWSMVTEGSTPGHILLFISIALAESVKPTEADLEWAKQSIKASEDAKARAGREGDPK